MLAGGDGKAGKHKAQCVKDGPGDDGASVAEAFGYGPENRLANAPGKVLDGNGHGKVGAEPAKFGCNGKLEYPKTGANSEVEDQDHRSRD